MFDKQQKLEVTRGELAVIEAALHTQAKILNFQVSAGGNAARRRLNEVKRALAHVSQQKAAEDTRSPFRFWNWFGLARTSG